VHNDAVTHVSLDPTDPCPVSEADLEGLPDAAVRYLRCMQVVGRRRHRSFRVRLAGTFRMRPTQAFMPFSAWQYNTVDPVARLFHMRIDMGHVLPMVGRDSYLDGRGAMHGRLLGIVPVADAEGPELDVSELTTWVNDAVLLAPSMLLGSHSVWQELDDDSFELTVTDRDQSVTAKVFLDSRGAPRDFRSTDRYATLGTGLTRAEWRTPIHGFTVVDGRPSPGRASAIWALPAGPFEYARAQFDTNHLTYDLEPEELMLP